MGGVVKPAVTVNPSGIEVCPKPPRGMHGPPAMGFEICQLALLVGPSVVQTHGRYNPTHDFQVVCLKPDSAISPLGAGSWDRWEVLKSLQLPEFWQQVHGEASLQQHPNIQVYKRFIAHSVAFRTAAKLTQPR